MCRVLHDHEDGWPTEDGWRIIRLQPKHCHRRTSRHPSAVKSGHPSGPRDFHKSQTDGNTEDGWFFKRVWTPYYRNRTNVPVGNRPLPVRYSTCSRHTVERIEKRKYLLSSDDENRAISSSEISWRVLPCLKLPETEHMAGTCHPDVTARQTYKQARSSSALSRKKVRDLLDDSQQEEQSLPQEPTEKRRTLSIFPSRWSHFSTPGRQLSWK
jgi:hypothetical protein